MPEAPRPPRWILPLQLFYLAALITLATLYHESSTLRSVFPDPSGSIPLAVPWWGALGGITISCAGVFRNARRWNNHYNSWHIARPFLGAVAGSVGYLVFIVIIRTTGASVPSASAASRPVFDLVAFLLGYREEVFRELLLKCGGHVVSTGSK